MIDQNSLLDDLKKLTEAQIEELCFRLRVERTQLRWSGSSLTEKATQMIQYLAQREQGLQDLQEELQDQLEPETDSIPDCPYRGLLAFQEEDAEFFFGREAFLQDVVEDGAVVRQGLERAVRTKRLVAVVGASGSGKSSLVFAGLIPRLRKLDNWLIDSFRPQHQPFDELAAALVRHLYPKLEGTACFEEGTKLAKRFRDGTVTLQQAIARIEAPQSRTLLLVIDQFEELYTLSPEKDRIPFLDLLLAGVKNVPELKLVLTLRADFCGQAYAYRPFADALHRADMKLGSMNLEELREVIVKPAEKLGVQVEEELVDRILDDVKQAPGNLPLLEFALTSLWQRQRQRKLTYKAYKEIGAVTKALANYADIVYLGLSEEDQKRTRRIFVQLVCPGDGTEDTRRVATRTEVGADNWDLVTTLAGSRPRLVVTGRDEDTVEVVHEALLWQWELLQTWIKSDRAFRLWQEGLRFAQRQWQRSMQDEGALLEGVLLGEAERWLSERKDELSLKEQEFIQLSLDKRDRHILEKNQQQQQLLAQERKARKAAETKNTVAIIAAIGVSILAVIAMISQQEAEFAQILTLEQTSKLLLPSNQDFDALIASVKAFRKLKGIPGFLLAFREFKEKPDIQWQVISSLQEGVYKVREHNRLEKHEDEVLGVSFSPNNGDIIATASKDNTVKLWSSHGKEIKTLIVNEPAEEQKHNGSVNNVIFNHSGTMIATASDDGAARLWTRQGEKWKLFKTLKKEDNTKKIFGISFSPNGALLATANEDGTIQIWATSEGNRILKKKAHKDGVLSVSFSHDGTRLATASMDTTAKLWTFLTGGEKLKEYDLKENKSFKVIKHSDWIRDVSFSHDDKMIATASKDRTVKLWKPDGTQLQEFKGEMEFRSVRFSPDDKILAATSADKNVYLLSLDDWEEIQTLTGHKNEVLNSSFSSNGDLLATASKDKTVKLWKVRNQQGKEELLSLPADDITFGTLSPDGKKIATASRENIVEPFTPDGKKITTSSGKERSIVRIWSRDGEKLKYVNVDYPVTFIGFRPNSQQISIAGKNGTVELWNYNDLKRIKSHCSSHDSAITSVSFSPDGKKIATASNDKTVKLCSLDGTESKPPKTLINRNTDPITSVSFSPDGEIIATTSWDWTIKLWTPEGNQIGTTIDDQDGHGGHKDGVLSVSFSRDGKVIATASEDRTVKLWTPEGKLINTINMDAAVLSVSFSRDRDGRLLATAGADNIVRLWRLEGKDLKELKTFRNHARVSNLSFSDSKTIAFSNGAGRFILWDLNLTPDDLLKRGCEVLHDYLKTNRNVSESDSHLCDGIVN